MVLLRQEENSINRPRSRSSIEEDDETLFERSSSASQVFRDLKANITVEPMMFLHMCGLMVSSVMLQNMYIDRICRIRDGYNETICGSLDDPESPYESIVDKDAASYVMYRGAIETGFPIVLSLFLGPWTDKHRTKPTMLIPLFGYVLSGALYLLFAFLPDVHPHYFLISSVPIALSGGMISLVLSVFSFIAKCTDSKNRSFRIAMLEVFWFLGIPIGLTIGAVVFKKFGYPGVFITSTSLFLLSFITGCVFVKESKPDFLDIEESRKNIFMQLFNVEAVKDIFATIFRPRTERTRALILLLILAMCLKIFTLFGSSNVAFLFVRNQLSWDYKEYTTFATLDSTIQIFGGWIMIFLTMKMFKMNDTTIGMLSSLGYCAAAVVIAFATAGWMMYLGAVIQMFCGLTTVVIRSMLSKCVAKEELAKVYTFVSCGEALMPLLATVTYSSVYQATRDTFPGAMYLITATFNGVVFLLFIYFDYYMRKRPPHVPLDDNST